jgi:hypothetical protein
MKFLIRMSVLPLAVVTLLSTAQLALGLYDPNLGRWINRDPMGEAAGNNLYEFVVNNPLSYVDPLGLDSMMPGGNNAPVAITLSAPIGGGPVTANFPPLDPLAIGGIAAAAHAPATALAAGATAAARPICKKLKENLHFDGPKWNYKDPQTGRIGQIRWGDTPLLRLDYHALPGPDGRPVVNGTPVLHFNIGPGEGKDSIHFVIGGESYPSMWQ